MNEQYHHRMVHAMGPRGGHSTMPEMSRGEEQMPQNQCAGQGARQGTRQGTSFGCAMPSLAMVYSPEQTFDRLYSEEEALSHGTLFCDLNKPFYGARRVQ